ncbi:uncharacterized protein LOC141897929 [Acropora palmata]|uniref:uncharacterized protein LOC141897929 n=1 Tax=Acropora palmata TaxID=6131 RepID=UPI003DA14577
MASSSSAVNDSVILTEDDIPGASLAGRNPSLLKNEEVRFWLRCRGDSLKGLKTKALLVKRVEEYVKSGRDQIVIYPDPDEIYTKRKNCECYDEQHSFVITQREIPKRWLGKFSGKNVFIHRCRNESAYYEFREESREHPTSFYSNKFKKGENFFDRPIFKRYRGS